MLKDITNNPLLNVTHEVFRDQLRKRFPEIKSSNCAECLCLSKYLHGTPHRFFAVDVFECYLAWLQERDAKNRKELQQYITVYSSDLSGALLQLNEINELNWHDHFETQNDYDLIRFIDQNIHPTYQRLTEAVLRPFLHIAAFFSRKDHNKGTDGLDIWQIINELKGSSLDVATIPYNHTVRNGIAHGGVVYLQKEIRYKDKKGNEEKLADDIIIRLCDDMVDTCNALSLALCVFILSHQEHGYTLPRQLLIEELKEETRAPWWDVIGCTPSEFSGLNQLLVYARANTCDYNKVQMSAFHSGVLAEKYAPGYDRYFLSITSDSSWPGWAAFNGKKLCQLRNKSDACFADYKGVLEDKLIFYVPRWKLPRFAYRLCNMFLYISLHWPKYLSDLRSHFGWPELVVRQSKIHRNSWGCVLNSDVYIQLEDGEVTKEVVRKTCRKIVSKSFKYARYATPWYKLFRFLPLGYALISVYRKDYRLRRLASFGLDSDRIATIRVHRLKRIKMPDIFGATIEYKGHFRIAWNKAWLEDTSKRK